MWIRTEGSTNKPTMYKLSFFIGAFLTFLLAKKGEAASFDYIGCYRDSLDRDLLVSYYDFELTLTPQICADQCAQDGYRYFGTQHADECYCGDSYGSQGEADNCDNLCVGDDINVCGGDWANSVYSINRDYGYIGCYRDSLDRDLPETYYDFELNLTLSICANQCSQAGYLYFGVQHADECYCGDSYGSQGPADNCDNLCVGDGVDVCGGDWANSVYAIDRTYDYIGCYRDSLERDLPESYYDFELTLTPDICADQCRQEGFVYFGIQHADECYCGDFYGDQGPADNCDMSCVGDDTEICGGEWANSVYSLQS